jgi:small subunit ribosomal protein S16
MVTIRLMRTGKKNRPHYRVVVQETRRKANGSYLEAVGTYDPLDRAPLRLDLERVRVWQAKGAEVSSTVRALIRRAKTAAAAAA